MFNEGAPRAERLSWRSPFASNAAATPLSRASMGDALVSGSGGVSSNVTHPRSGVRPFTLNTSDGPARACPCNSSPSVTPSVGISRRITPCPMKPIIADTRAREPGSPRFAPATAAGLTP